MQLDKLSASDWVAIGIAIAGAIAAIFRYIWTRFIRRWDQVQDDLHGREGIVAKLRMEIEQRVAQESFDVEMSEIQGRFNALMAQGEKREVKILEAIERMENHMREDNRLMRADLAGVNQRVDALMRGERPRPSRHHN